MEIRILKTDDGKSHGYFCYEFTDNSQIAERFADETDYNVDQITVTEKTI